MMTANNNPSANAFSTQVPALLEHHHQHLVRSAMTDQVMVERKYESILGEKRLEQLGFTKAQRRTPGILMPLWGVDGQIVGHQYRPDNPRNRNGKAIKYETPSGAANRIDCPLRYNTGPKAIPERLVPKCLLFIREIGYRVVACELRGKAPRWTGAPYCTPAN